MAGTQFSTRNEASRALWEYQFRANELDAWRAGRCSQKGALPTCLSSVIESAFVAPGRSVEVITEGWVPRTGLYRREHRSSTESDIDVLQACGSTYDCPSINGTTDTDSADDTVWAASYCATGEGGASVCLHDRDPENAEDECCYAKVGRTTNRPDLVPTNFCLSRCRPLECPLTIGKYGVLHTTVKATGQPVECRYGVTRAESSRARSSLWTSTIAAAIVGGIAWYFYKTFIHEKGKKEFKQARMDRYRFLYNADERAGPVGALVRREDPIVEVQARKHFESNKNPAYPADPSNAPSQSPAPVWDPSISYKNNEDGTFDTATLLQAGAMVPYEDAEDEGAACCCISDARRWVFVVLCNNQGVLMARLNIFLWLAGVAIDFAAILGNGGREEESTCADGHESYPDSVSSDIWCDTSQRDGESKVSSGASYALMGMLVDVFIVCMCWLRPQFLPGSPYNHMHTLRTARYGTFFPPKHRRPSDDELREAVDGGTILLEEDIRAKLNGEGVGDGGGDAKNMEPVAATEGIVVEVPAEDSAESSGGPSEVADNGDAEGKKKGEEEKEDEVKAEIMLGDYLSPYFPWWLKSLIFFHRFKCLALLFAIYVEYERAHAANNLPLMITQGVATLINLPSGIMGAFLIFYFMIDLFLMKGGCDLSTRLDPTGAPPGQAYALEPLSSSKHPARARSYDTWIMLWNAMVVYGI